MAIEVGSTGDTCRCNNHHVCLEELAGVVGTIFLQISILKDSRNSHTPIYTTLAERQVLRGKCRAALEPQPEEDRDDLQHAH